MNLSKLKSRVFCVLLLGLFLNGCYKYIGPVRTPCSMPSFQDDLNFRDLSLAVQHQLTYLEKHPSWENNIVWGADLHITRDDIVKSLTHLKNLLESTGDLDQLHEKIYNNFQCFQTKGRDQNRKTLFTGYYEPLYEASLSPHEDYPYPLYNMPPGLVKIPLSQFRLALSRRTLLGRKEGDVIVPFYSRTEIDVQQALNSKGLEIAWLKDNWERSVLQIQGSGALKLADGSVQRVRYAGKNGWPYTSIGRVLVDDGLMELEDVNMDSIRNYLESNPDQASDIILRNESYVFFDLADGGPYGGQGVQLTPMRSLAMDKALFPYGVIVLIQAEKPILNEAGEIETWQKFWRVMINQDTGGAIKGPGRADIFWGSGAYAEKTAGHLKHQGKMYILLTK